MVPNPRLLKIIREITDGSCATGERRYVTEDGGIWRQSPCFYFPNSRGAGDRYGIKTNGSIEEL